MSNIVRKLGINKYKTLYKIEVENRKKYEEEYRRKCKENIELQKQVGMPELRLELNKVKCELQDTKGLWSQDIIAKKVLLKRQDKLKSTIESNKNKTISKEFINDVLNGKYDNENEEVEEDGE